MNSHDTAEDIALTLSTPIYCIYFPAGCDLNVFFEYLFSEEEKKITNFKYIMYVF